MMLVSCGVPTETTPRSISDNQLPDGLRPANATGQPASAASEAIRVWLVRDDGLTSVIRRIDSPATTLDVLASLGIGPSDIEQRLSLRSALPDASLIIDAQINGGTAVVGLDSAFDQIPATDQVLAIGQVVLTLTNLRGVGQVRFERDGSEVAVPLPDGRSVDRAVSADDFVALTG
ncbi:MAG: GerMN domain-containing protein [Ilumatobacteraceae bacterium]